MKSQKQTCAELYKEAYPRDHLWWLLRKYGEKIDRLEKERDQLKMDYQKFNDAMQRIQKAQSDLNDALRDIFMAVSKEEMAPYYGKMEDEGEEQS